MSKNETSRKETDWLLKPQTEKVIKKQKFAFDWQFFKRLAKILHIIFQEGRTVLFALLITATSFFQIFVVSKTGDVNGGFYQTIISKDEDAFKSVVYLALAVIALSALLDSTIKFLVEVLAWRSRRNLCLHLHQKYFVNTLYYKLTSFDSRVDNPDQRITQDVDNFSSTYSNVLAGFVTAPATIIYYAVKTWLVIGWFAPAMITGYFFLGYAVNKLIMSPIVQLVFQQEQLEGDFRFAHVRVRTCAESIALFDGADRERNDSEDTFRALLRNKLRLMRWHWGLNASSNLFAYLGGALNYITVGIAVLYLHKDINADPMFVAQATFNCIQLIFGFTQLMNLSQPLSDLAGYTARISDMLETLKDLEDRNFFLPPSSKDNNEGSSDNEEDVVGEVHHGDLIQFDNVTCYTPNGIRLVEKLSFFVRPGDNLLIMGPSGSGKSSILRILNGLWPPFGGSITKPPNSKDTMIYLPQQPYLFRGSLKEQIIYPAQTDINELTESDFVALLESVNLSYLLDNYDENSNLNWNNILSPGEQQLISFARLFYHKPKFAVLDEATSSIPEEMEQQLYNTCKEIGITLVSVGHRSTLLKYHNSLLKLNSKRQWEFSNSSSS